MMLAKARTRSAPARPGTSAAAVLQFIKKEIAAGRRFPTRAQIATHMGWRNQSSAEDALMRAAANGDLVVEHRARSGRGFRYTYALPGPEQVKA